MTPEEKWKRIQSPSSVADYALTISVSELQTFDEGRKRAAEFLEVQSKWMALPRNFPSKLPPGYELVTYGETQVLPMPPNEDLTSACTAQTN